MRETVRVIDGQYELQGGDGSNSADLAKPYGFGIAISSEMFNALSKAQICWFKWEIVSSNGIRLGFSSSGTQTDTLLGKENAPEAGARRPTAFKMPRTALIKRVLDFTSRSRALNCAKSG